MQLLCLSSPITFIPPPSKYGYKKDKFQIYRKKSPQRLLRWPLRLRQVVIVPDHDGGRPIEVNACILITHMVYL